MNLARAKVCGGLAGLALPLALAACGGGGSSSGDPNSANYSPAETTIKDAGLEACSEAENQIPQSLASGPGVQNTRSFFIAKDCMGKETAPNTVMVFQFDSKQSVDAGYANVKAAMPNGTATKYGPLILVTTGPDRAENMTAILAALNKTYPTTSSS